LHSGVRIARLAVICAVVVAAGILLVSGGEDGGPRTPKALPGLPSPFLGTAVTGDGEMTAAVDAYGDVVDLRPGPAGKALIYNPSDRQAAGTVAEDTGIVPRVSIDGGEPLAMWEADRVTQRYLAGTNVVRTVAWFGGDGGSGAARVVMTVAASGRGLGMEIGLSGGANGRPSPTRVAVSVGVAVADGVRCARRGRAALPDLICRLGRGVPPVSRSAAGIVRAASREGRGWLARSNGLGAGAPDWARRMYTRSLLSVHALTSESTGAVAAGARDGWAYVWPRDAATAALALAASGHHAEARAVAKFLTGLKPNEAARFDEAGAPIPGRAAQGDALGWVDTAAKATGVPTPDEPYRRRDRADYQESSPGTYLGNALAAAAADVDGPKTRHMGKFSAHQQRGGGVGSRVLREFGSELGLVRVAGDVGSGLDSAAGWAVRPFRLSALYPAAERTLLRLVEGGTPYGITPGEGWEGGEDPWTAPTAWSAWALAGLAREGRGAADRRAALELVADLRRAATPAGDLPERVGAHTGIPTSTTPLLWSSAFAVLALRELWGTRQRWRELR
jgi:glucoamylase